MAKGLPCISRTYEFRMGGTEPDPFLHELVAWDLIELTRLLGGS
jgi:hypothetical protein